MKKVISVFMLVIMLMTSISSFGIDPKKCKAKHKKAQKEMRNNMRKTVVPYYAKSAKQKRK
jgi:hypothetical protein